MAIRVDDVDLTRDAALVERFQQGDRRAFEDLYRRYFDRLCRYCERRVGDTAVAEEIAQEAFARALQALPRFGGDRRFYPWMTVIAQRLCVDHHRARVRLVPTPDVDDARQADAAHESVLQQVDLDHLDQALERVRSRHREVLQLRDYRGLSYDEIALELHVPVTTVHALLHRARSALRREFHALAGPERLAALPVLGLVARSWERLKARLGSWASVPGAEQASGLAPLAAAAATVAVGALALLPSAGETPAPVDQQVVTTVGTASTEPPAPALVVESNDDAPLGVAGAGTERPAPASGPDPAPEPDVQVGTVDVFVGPDGSGRARDEAEEMPVNTGLGPVFAGIDPDQVVAEVHQLAPVFGGQP